MDYEKAVREALPVGYRIVEREHAMRSRWRTVIVYTHRDEFYALGVSSESFPLAWKHLHGVLVRKLQRMGRA